jgi:hypothetical protein
MSFLLGCVHTATHPGIVDDPSPATKRSHHCLFIHREPNIFDSTLRWNGIWAN